MGKILSCGIIPYSVKNGRAYFFVGHPGGKPENLWGMLKGQHETGESYDETALREFKEESGVDLSGYKDRMVFLGKITQSRHKDVIAYALRVDDIGMIDPDGCSSNMADGCPWPEIDEYGWKTYDELRGKIHPAHSVFYNKILSF